MGRLLLGLLLILSVFCAVRAAISNLRLCGDPECKEPVSKGVTVLSYPSNDKDILSFPNNAQVLVYSKEAGSRRDLWGVEIKGKRGYAPSKYIREHKIYKSKLPFEVPTEPFLGKEKTEHGKQNLSEELASQGTKAEEEQATQELTETLDDPKERETDSDFTKSLKVAITAEDVEFNSLPPVLPPGEQVSEKEATTHTIPKDSSVETEEDTGQPTNSEGSTTGHATQEEKEELEEEEEGEEEQKEEKEDGSQEESDDLEGMKNKDSGDEAVGNGGDRHVEVTEVPTIATPPEDDKKEKEEAVDKEKIISEGDLLVRASEPPLEPEPEPPQPLNPQVVSQEVKESPKEPEESIVTLEPSTVSFEVIDGTTVYLDEDTSTTATTTPTNSHTSEPPVASPVMGEAPAAAATLPIPALLHHPPPASPSKNSKVPEELPHVESPKLTTEVDSSLTADSVPLPESEELSKEGQETASGTVERPVSSTESETTAATEAELYLSEIEKTSTAEETGPQLEDSTGESSKEIEEDIISSLGTDAEVEEAVPTTEAPEDEFGAPKQESIIESNDITTEEPVESQGFFASWFGSSETPDSLEAEESPETPEPSESEAPLDDGLDIEATSLEVAKDINDEHNHGGTANVHDTPPDAMSVPINESEGVSTDVKYPNATDNVDEVAPNSTEDVEENAPKSSEPGIPLMESSSSASPDKEEQSPKVLPPSPADASSTDFVHDTNETAEGSEEDAGVDLGDDEEEPGPSTARPIYAEPEPTTQSYTDASVDPDELAHLAGTKETADSDAQESSAEESLTQKFLKASHNLLPEGLAFGVEAEMAEPEVSQGALVFLAIVVFTIITIYIVHLIMMKLSRESPILAALNNMDREKRILLHENATLHEELCKAHTELEAMASRITESNGDATELDAQLDLIKKSLDHASILASVTEKQLVVEPEREPTTDEREHAAETAQQEEKIVQLEHELEEATSNSLEMHKMLSEMLSAQKDTSTFQASVDHLQEMLDGQQEKVEALNSDLALKTRLNEELHLELSASREQVSKLDTQVQQLTQSLKDLSSAKEETSQHLLKEIELVKELQTVNESISKQSKNSDEQLSILQQELQALQDTIATLRESVETKDSELKVAKECLKQMQLTSEDSKVLLDDEKLSSLFDVIKIKAELRRVSGERLNLEDQLRESEMAQKNLEDTMSSIRSEVTELRTMHDDAIHDKQEAMSKLAVLTQYFEEKEAQLTRELESQEGLRMNAEGTAASVAQKIHNYELEVASYKDIKNLPEAKREMIHRMSMEQYDFGDLSPTTGNVPVSDEYKVEWVKAKAELKRKKSAAFTTGTYEKKEEVAAPTVTSILQSSDSSHSSDSAQGLSDSPSCSVDSPVPQEIKSGSKIEQLESTGTAPKIELLPSISVAPSSGSFIKTSFSRPSSLKISTRSDNISTGLVTPSDTLPTSATSNFCSLATQHSSVENEPQLSTSVEGPSRSSYDLGLHSAKLVDLGTVVYDNTFDVALQETAASDDVKSTVAAMKSIFERDAQLRSMSETLPFGSGEKLVSFGTTVKSSLSSRSHLKIEEREPNVLNPSHMTLMLDNKKKTQVESLRKELQAQEESYKTQIASYEQKAHDNWLQARTAERKHEEQRQENSQLRNRLTLLQKEREDIQGGILKPTPKRLDANGRIPSPGALIEGEVDGDHSETPPHPIHGPPSMLPPMMLPPGAPLPPGIPPPHGFPGVPPPPPPPGLPRGVPPPFLHGELPFMRPPYPPLPGDRRLPPAGGMSSPPYRRSGSPSYNHRNDRYSPSSEHSHLSDRHYSPPPLRHRPPSPDMHRRNHSPDRRSDRLRSPDRRSDRVRASPDHHRSNRRTPDRRLDRRSPDRHFTRSPDGYHRHRSSPHDYYDHSDYNSDDSRLHQTSSKGKKTSTPLAPSDRWKNDV